MKDFLFFSLPSLRSGLQPTRPLIASNDPLFSLATCGQRHTPPGTAIRMITGKFSVLTKRNDDLRAQLTHQGPGCDYNKEQIFKTKRNIYGTACLAKLNYGLPKDLKH